MRFDCRGMGDSEGRARTFEEIDLDIECAVDKFVQEAGVSEIVLWGLCDGASAAIFYGHQDPRVVGLVILNPWVRSEQSLASVYLRQYYVSRFLTQDFWKSLFAGKIRVSEALIGVAKNIRNAFGVRSNRTDDGHESNQLRPKVDDLSLGERMADSLRRFAGRTLVILSGKDLTAAEFLEVTRNSASWQRELESPTVEVRLIQQADHTFSNAKHRSRMEDWTVKWVKGW